ncbi:branched-chain amino acid ABC transporter permease [Natrarchaeobius sp. A-rgal3]|uniref:branched-chain amino acid ABC transporter permease n=1 Tax=Natrarchaeobius versutus TaxID=1679078 RepID=UPI0035107E9C
MPTDTITSVLELTVDGISRGLVFALLGLGITLVFGMGGVLNLAIGVFSIIAILVVLGLLGFIPNLAVAIVLAVVLVGVFGLIVDRSLLPFIYSSEGEERVMLGIFTTLGFGILLEGLLVLQYPNHYTLSAGIPSMEIAGLYIRGSSIGVIAVGLLTFVALYLLFSRTYAGKAMRTVMQDEVGAILCGIDVRKTRTVVFILSTVIAAIAGILYSFSYEVNIASAFQLTIYAVMVSIVGGVTSITGTVIAGIGLGLVVTFASAYAGAYVSQIALFAVAIVVLLAKPEQIA